MIDFVGKFPQCTVVFEHQVIKDRDLGYVEIKHAKPWLERLPEFVFEGTLNAYRNRGLYTFVDDFNEKGEIYGVYQAVCNSFSFAIASHTDKKSLSRTLGFKGSKILIQTIFDQTGEFLDLRHSIQRDAILVHPNEAQYVDTKLHFAKNMFEEVVKLYYFRARLLKLNQYEVIRV